jgi:uncharacterized protein
MMQASNNIITAVVVAILVGLVSLILIFLSPLKSVNWGKVSLQPSQTVTVSGEAKTQQKNQTARFSAGVNSIYDDKDKAIQEVNQKMQALIDAVKGFGIPQEDIKTQNISVYQSEEMYYDSGTQKSRPGQWRVSNSIEIKLKDITRATALSEILSSSGATTIYGPDFSIDDTDEASKELLQKAIDNAREKAEIMANASNKNLGEVLSVNEGYTQSPGIYSMALDAGGRGGGGSPTEPGSQTISKSVTVTFELK